MRPPAWHCAPTTEVDRVVPHDDRLRAGPYRSLDANLIGACRLHFDRPVRMNDAPRCPRCRDVIGVYEPIILLLDGRARETSRAAEPDVDGRGERYHWHCYAQLLGADSADETIT